MFRMARNLLAAFLFVSTSWQSFAQETAGAERKPSGHQTIDWYRAGKTPLPRAGLTIRPDAKKRGVYETFKARALLSQIKYELATGTYWKISKAERNRLIAVLDDPSTNYIYTGKTSRALFTAGAQTIDAKTVLLNDAIFHIGAGSKRGTPKSLWRVAEVLLHEAVHVDLVRTTGVVHVTSLQKEDHPNEVESQFQAAMARFAPGLIAELDRYVKDPAGYGKDPAAAKVPPAPHPPYDATALKRADAVLRATLAEAKKVGNQAMAACRPVSQSAGIAAILEKTRNDTMARLAAQGKAPRAVLLADRTDMAKLESLRSVLGGLEERAVDSGDKVCRLSRAPAPDMAAAGHADAIAQAAVQAARDMMGKAEALAGRLTASLEDVSKIPVGGSRVTQDTIVNNQVKICQGKAPDVSPLRAAMANSRRKATRQLALGRSLLSEAEAAKYEHADIYRARFSAHNASLAGIVNLDVELEPCITQSLKLKIGCVGLGNKLKIEADRQTAIANEAARLLIEQRAGQASRVRKTISAMKRLLARILTGAALSGTCLRVAEDKTKSPPVNPLAGEADNLGNPAGLACNPAAFNRRMARLRAARFSAVPEAARALERLKAKSTHIQAALNHIGKAERYNADGKPGPVPASLRAARAALARLGGMPDCRLVAERADAAERRAEQIGDLLSKVRTALTSCSATKAQAVVQAIDAIGLHNLPSRFSHARNRLANQADALSLYARAVSAIKAGQWDEGQRLLRIAKQRRNGAGKTDCPVLSEKIDRVAAGANRLREASKGCESGQFDRVKRNIGRLPAGLTKSFNARAARAFETCRTARPQITAAECTARMGPDARIIRDSTGGRDRCVCPDGYRTNGSGKCSRPEMDLVEMAQYCRQTYGEGHNYGRKGAGGKVICLPDQDWASRWCQRNNPGRGWRAVNISGPNTFDCRKSPASQQAGAEQNCRERARQNGREHIRTKLHPDGRYTCIHCPKGQKILRGGRCYTPWQAAENDCRRQARAKGRTHVRTRMKASGGYTCYSCPAGQRGRNGRCYTAQQLADNACRRQARQKGVVHSRAVVNRNGSYRCFWCQRGQVPRGTRCLNPRTATPRTATPQPRSGARYKCTVTHLDGSLLGTYGNRTSTFYSDRPQSNARCHRIR